MYKFYHRHIIKPLRRQWLKGLILLLLWTVAFIALPSISAWFLAMCSLAFVTSNIAFAYLIPSSIIRFMSIGRTALRYFERLQNHKTTLTAQQNLQLKIFKSVAAMPFFKKQMNNNSNILENATHGVDHILNHILLWLLPLSSLLITIIIYFISITTISQTIAIQFVISSTILLFIVPQVVFRENRVLFQQLKTQRQQHQQMLIQSFRGRIEVSKYNLQDKVIQQHQQMTQQIQRTETKIQNNSFKIQMLIGLSFSYLATFILWNASNHGLTPQIAVGIFFGIMAQAELAEILFSGKSEKNAVQDQVNDLGNILMNLPNLPAQAVQSEQLPQLQEITLKNIVPHIPQTNIHFPPFSIKIDRGEWIAVYGQTGKGKSTLLNSLFYPDCRKGGDIYWNNHNISLSRLPAPQAIYVTQKAYLLTGTLRENFLGYTEQQINDALQTVDLLSWRDNLTQGLDTWIGENGETLSGGQRKKLLLAQALLKKPQLLVVDEPTAGISPDNAIQIFQNIKKQHPQISILMATHLKDFESVVDKIVSL